MADEIFEVGLFVDPSPMTVGIAGGTALFQAFSNSLRESLELSKQLAEQTNTIRDSLRDVRALQGPGAGVSDQVLRTQIDLIKASGMTATEAHDFVAQYLGEAEAYRGKAGAGEYERLETMSAQYSVAKGGDPQLRAKVAGRLLGMGGEDRTAESVMGEMAEVNRLLELGSGNTVRLTKSWLNASSSMLAEGGGGAVGSARNLAALAMGASRLGSEYSVDTTLEQFGKAVQGFGPEKWQTFVKEGLGVKEGTKVEDAMRPMFAWMEQQQAHGRDLNAVLQEQGLDRTEMRRSLVGMFNQRQYVMGELDRPGSLSPGGRMAGIGEVQQTISGFQRSREGQARLAEAEVLGAQTEIGMRHEEVNIWRRRAYANLLQTGELGPEAIAGKTLENLLAKSAGTTAEEMMIEKRAREMFEKENQTKLGTDPSQANLHKVVGIVAGETAARTLDQYTGVRSNQLQRDIQDYRDAMSVGDRGRTTTLGPTGKQMTTQEFEAYYRQQGRSDDEVKTLMKGVADRMQNERRRPMAAIAPARRVRP